MKPDSIQVEGLLCRVLGRKSKWPVGLISLAWEGHAACLGVMSHMTIEERCLLYRLARSLAKNARCVEIGSYVGASACVLAAGVSRADGEVVCVDPWTNESMSEGRRDTYDEFLSNTRPYAKWVRPWRMKSDEAAGSFNGRANLIFIDGDHEYHAVHGDVSNWLPKLADDGWIVLHDSGWADGVKRVIAEALQPLHKLELIQLPNMYAARIGKH